MSAQGSGAALFNVAHDSLLRGGECVGEPVGRAVSAKDIGDFDRHGSGLGAMKLCRLKGPQPVQRAGESADGLGGEFEIARGRRQAAVAQQQLDRSQVGARFQQMGRKGVPEAVGSNGFWGAFGKGMRSTFPCLAESGFVNEAERGGRNREAAAGQLLGVDQVDLLSADFLGADVRVIFESAWQRQ